MRETDPALLCLGLVLVPPAGSRGRDAKDENGGVEDCIGELK